MSHYKIDPTVFHPTFGQHTPIQHLVSGDIVDINLIDAHAFDSQGIKRVDYSNPLVGPFFIEDLEPGDSLSVELKNVQPDRKHGWSYATPSPTIVEPTHIASMPIRKLVTWNIDYVRQVAFLAEPPKELAKFEIPLMPMVGCLGVAPDHSQAITSYSSGNFGGNMDCPLITTNCKIDLPVFVHGGLLFIGDMHAAQSDGEISSAAIEISGTVRFSVRVNKGKTIQFPHGENESSIFTIGSGRPLDMAMQHATSEMIRRLKMEYGFSEESAILIMGQCVTYMISNAVNEKFTVACILNKSIIPAR